MWLSEGIGAAAARLETRFSDIRLASSLVAQKHLRAPNLIKYLFISIIPDPAYIVFLLRSIKSQSSPNMVYQTQLQAKFAHTVGEPVPKMNSEYAACPLQRN